MKELPDAMRVDTMIQRGECGQNININIRFAQSIPQVKSSSSHSHCHRPRDVVCTSHIDPHTLDSVAHRVLFSRGRGAKHQSGSSNVVYIACR